MTPDRGFHRTELLFGVVLLALLVAAWVSLEGVPFEAQLFPRMVIGLTVLMTLLLVARAAVGRSAPVDRPEDGAWTFFIHIGRFCLMAAALPAYVLAISQVGYFTATAPFIVALALILGYRRPVALVVIALVFDTAIYLIFVAVFERRLPADLLLGQ